MKEAIDDGRLIDRPLVNHRLPIWRGTSCGDAQPQQACAGHASRHRNDWHCLAPCTFSAFSSVPNLEAPRNNRPRPETETLGTVKMVGLNSLFSGKMLAASWLVARGSWLVLAGRALRSLEASEASRYTQDDSQDEGGDTLTTCRVPVSQRRLISANMTLQRLTQGTLRPASIRGTASG